jgi:predicted acylesterase/phospholipase RssA
MMKRRAMVRGGALLLAGCAARKILPEPDPFPSTAPRCTPKDPEPGCWRALVLGGGGSTGEFQMGVLSVLSRVFTKFDFFAGLGVGSLHSTVLAQYPDSLAAGVAVLQDVWAHIQGTGDIFDVPFGGSSLSSLFALANWRDSVYGNGKIRDLVRARVDWKRLVNQVNWGIATTSMDEGLTYYVTNDESLSDLLNTAPRAFKPSYRPGDALYVGSLLHDFIIAAGSVPMILPPVTIAGQRFAEGGVRRFLPYPLAVQAYGLALAKNPSLRAEFVIVDNYTEEIESNGGTQVQGGKNLLMRTIKVMTTQVAQGDLVQGASVFPPATTPVLHELYPRKDWLLDPQNFDDLGLRADLHNEGISVALQVFPDGFCRSS